MSLFGAPPTDAGRWFNIPAHRPFLDDLAAGIHQALNEDGPEALADAVILVPNRRAARALSQSFVKATGGRALVLPQIRALGDLDEGEPPFEPGEIVLDLPPAVSPLRRRFELARLAHGHADALGRELDAAAALELGDALGGFFDSLEIEEVDEIDRARIGDLVHGDLALHWQVSAKFLRLVVEDWPERLAELGLIDVTARRVRLLHALAESWTVRPPNHPVIAAGSTGSAPATAALLRTIAKLPQGCVVLPGLDEGLSDEAWTQVRDEAGDQHPQGALKRLLEGARLEREAVAPWPASLDTAGRMRRRVINEALRPAAATADWLGQIERLGAPAIAEGLEGLSVMAARNEEEAATLIAILLRETLETPGATAALITPDQALSRRVCARLARWDVAVDTSSGRPLLDQPVGVLLDLIARSCAEPHDPVLLLALLKHPLVTIGREEGQPSRAAAALERHGLRGPRPRDWEALRHRLDDHPEAQALMDALRAALSLAACETASAAQAAGGLARVAEALAPEPWSGVAGQAASELLAGLIQEGEVLPPVTPLAFAVLLERLLAAESVRPAGGVHRRIQILGALEGRLIQADRLILAGLEEGTWPAAAPTDPFLPRPMRRDLGLPSPERRIGLSAHDFAQAACAPDVVLIHSERTGGQLAVKSRWLWRLETLARGAQVELPQRPEVAAWAVALDAPPATPATAPRPRPAPPLEVRPKGLSATRVERWIRDPYAIYGQYVLGLRPLDPPDAPVGPRERGTAIHLAMERLAALEPDEAVIHQSVVDALEEAGLPEARLVREKVLAANLAPWLAAFERERRAGARLLIEQKGVLRLLVDGETWELAATADRIELRGGPGALRGDIIDFKTGHAPSKKEVQAHLAPQLTLTAAILERGGFDGVGRAAAGELAYVKLKGGRVQGEVAEVGQPDESSILAAEVIERLERRIRAFRNPDTGYISRAVPQFAGEVGDYDHLARVWEWSVADAGEGGE